MPRSTRFKGTSRFKSTSRSKFVKPNAKISNYLYPDNWKEISSAIKKRDNYTCRVDKIVKSKVCSLRFPPPFSHLLHVHHIVPLPKGSNLSNNLITLCNECHGFIHGKNLGSLSYKQKQVGLRK